MNAFASPRAHEFSSLVERPATSHRERVVSLAEVSWRYPALGAIHRLANLAQNWDGYGSPAIARDAIAVARKLLLGVEHDDLPTPDLLPISGGGVGIHWKVGTRELEFAIHPDKTVTYLRVLADSSGGEEVNEGTLSSRLKEDLRPLARWLAQV